MSHQRSAVVLLSILSFIQPVLGQTPAPPAPQDPPAPAAASPSATATKEEQEKAKLLAVELLREVADEGGRMRLVENRIYFQTAAADLLWEQDEKAARNLFQFAMADVRSLYANDADDDVEASHQYRRRSEAGSLRQNLLVTLAGRDAKLARTFLRETHDLATAAGNEAYGPYGNDEQLELTLAMQIAQSDPEQALEIGRQSLAKGFAPQVVTLAQTLYKKSPETAAKLIGETVAKLKTANLTEDTNAAALAITTFQVGLSKETKPKADEKDKVALVDDAAMRDLAEMIAQAAQNAGPENYNLVSVRSLLDQMEKYAPARVKQLRRKLGAEQGFGSPEADSWVELTRLREEGNVDQLIEAAEKPSNAGNRPMFYDAAVSKLIEAGELDRARNLVNAKIPDADTKKRMLATIEQGALTQAAIKGNIEESRRMLSGLKGNEERIMVLTQLALAVAPKDRKAALLLLEEASNMMPVRARTYRQMFARLALIRAYAMVEPDQGFNILESSVDQANELLAAVFLVGEFIAEGEVVRDDEVAIFQMGRSLDGEIGQYRVTVNALALADFKRMKGVADRFQRPEIRLLARLLVVQSVLVDPEKEKENRVVTPTIYPGPID
jgi:hypothetical protein